MAGPYAFVTLLTSDAYLQGALTLVAALRDLHPTPAEPPEVDFQTVCLVTPETLDISTIKLLRKAFDVVVGVEVITQKDTKSLDLLGRPDLHTVLTKLHVFRLTEYPKIIFLDADVLPIRQLSHLFTLPHEFSAVPDVGWPDIFNSGVMVLSPGQEKFDELNSLLNSKGSWDGGDQGILNEWRGDDWNRLSFTYNTTPTAAYTYAPAYKRFGSQINAIHFIGPNKPWKSAGYRAPFTKHSQADESQPTHDYDSLVDEWFAVYDKHYRAQAVIPEDHFELQHYASAWERTDENSGAQAPATLNLDELKTLAIEGMGQAGLGNTSSAGDGEYRTMPLEGRFDLMRRIEEPSGDSLPIPGQNEPLPSPKLHSIPLAAASEVFNATTDFAPLISHHPAPQDHQGSDPVEQEPLRPSSPPKMLWNPAIEPPPTTAPSVTAFPSDTYFPNVWDQPTSRHHDQPHHPQQEESAGTGTGTFFQPPPSTYIPAKLIQEGHYRQVIGDADHHTPEPTKVRSVFPWEERPRHMPSRRFPDSDRPPPSAFASSDPVVESPPPKASSPEPVELTNKSPSPQAVSPGSPFSLTYTNAWDGVPSIQKYAERLVRPPPPQPLAPAFDPEDYRRSRGGWEDHAMAASEDGDDEDEGDDEQTPNGDRTRWNDDSDGEGSSKRKSRSRRDSDAVAATYIVKSKKKEYRVRGVQTVPREMRDQAVQVNIIDSSTSKVPHDHLHRKSSQDQSQPATRSSGFTRGNGRKQQWVPPTGALTPLVSNGSGAGPTSTTDFVASPTKEASGVRSPREFALPETPTTARLKQTATLSESTPSKRAAAASPVSTMASMNSSPSMTFRQLSHDGSSTASPPSSVGPLSPPEGQPLPRMGRKTGRVFDPARGVEVFKQGSEEVLARFLKMSSWENDR